MTRPTSDIPDAPFPGAHSQVAGAHSLGDDNRRQGHLPLDMRAERSGSVWAVRLPVRADMVTVEKRTVVIERVTASRRTLGERAQIEDSVRREVLRIDTDGDPNVRIES